MKVAVSVQAEVSSLPRACVLSVAEDVQASPAPALSHLGRRLADYVELTKPRVAVLVLFTVAAGVLLGAGPALAPLVLFHAVLGTALVAAGASALNQWLERDTDPRMRRTRKRPLPSGRLPAREALLFGLLLAGAGLAYLLLTLPEPWAALVALATLLGYVALYTPLKRRTVHNTLVGAIPGALPPVIGWCAVCGAPTWEAWPLFLVLFVWQVPHFLAIAWIYREEYARARLCMLPVTDRTGKKTAGVMLAFCLLLLVAGLTPVACGSASWLYLTGALVLGTGFLLTTVGFARHRGEREARLVLRASLVYLPALLALLLIDRFWL
jgi:protoheme IX farnesyltransferase